MDGLSIRRATPEDAPAIASLATQLGYPSNSDSISTRLADLLPRRDHSLLVAQTAAGQVVGWIHIGTLRWIENDPAAEIGGLVVDAAHRGLRIGERLVAAAISWAVREGYGEIRVRSNVVRAQAHRFYERLGFARTKVQHIFRRTLRGA